MAKQKERFFRTTKGFNAEVIVAKNVVYTTDATYALFVANAVAGEIGVFDADTNALVGANVPLVANQRYFIAQKRDQSVSKTTTSIFGAKTVKKTAYTAPVKQKSTVTFTGYTPVPGDEFAIKVIETTPGSEPFPTVTHLYTVKAGQTLAQFATAYAAWINSALNLENADGRKFVTATAAAGVITLEADYIGSSFRVALPGKTYNVATTAVTVPFVAGSGYPDKVSRDEIEGQIFEGVTTQYPGGTFSPDDFGAPNKFTDFALTYNIYNVRNIRNELSPTPINLHHHNWNAIIAVPVTGGPSLDVIFGLTPAV